MSVKMMATVALHEGMKQYALAIEKLIGIKGNENLSFQGRISMADVVKADFFRFIDGMKESMSKEVASAIEAAAKREGSERIRRSMDAAYQTVLSNTLQQIPFMVNSVPKEILKEKLSVFANDSLAIGMLKTALEQNGFMAAQLVLPGSTDGMAAELVSSVGSYTGFYLDQMKDSVLKNANAVNIAPSAIVERPYDTSMAMTVESYVSYLEGLSDDGSSYSEPASYKSATESNPNPAALAKMATSDSLGTIAANHSSGASE